MMDEGREQSVTLHGLYNLGGYSTRDHRSRPSYKFCARVCFSSAADDR